MALLLCPIKLRQVMLRNKDVYSKNQNGRKNKNSAQIYDKNNKTFQIIKHNRNHHQQISGKKGLQTTEFDIG